MKGFTIVELLVAMSITLLVAAATLSLVGPVHDAFQVQPESSDLQQRVRVGIDTLQRDLLMAGAGMYAAGSVGPLHHAVAPVMPYRAFGNVVRLRPEAPTSGLTPSVSCLSHRRPRRRRWRRRWRQAHSRSTSSSHPTCPPATVSQVCGFEAGDQVLVFDRGGWWDVFAVDRVEGVAGVCGCEAHRQRGVCRGFQRDRDQGRHLRAQRRPDDRRVSARTRGRTRSGPARARSRREAGLSLLR